MRSRGTFKIETSLSVSGRDIWVVANVSGYDDLGDYNNPPESHFEIEDISILDENTVQVIPFETLDQASQTKIDSKLNDLFFKKLAQNGPDEMEY